MLREAPDRTSVVPSLLDRDRFWCQALCDHFWSKQTNDKQKNIVRGLTSLKHELLHAAVNKCANSSSVVAGVIRSTMELGNLGYCPHRGPLIY